MATVNLESGLVTNDQATPRVLNSSHVEGGRLQSLVGTLEATAADDIGSTYRFFKVPSNARVDTLRIYSDDLGTTGDIDVGLYKTSEDGGAVVDADFFASALDVNAAALNGVDITHESGVFGVEDAEKPLWLALGLSADPKIFYDVVATPTEAIQAAGTITLKMHYAI